MNGLLISAIVITVLYTVVKFFQMRFIDKENKPLKELISDSCIVFLVTFAGMLGTIGNHCHIKNGSHNVCFYRKTLLFMCKNLKPHVL